MTEIRRKVPAAFEPLLYPKRYKGIYGGRGGAKSHFVAEEIVFRCMVDVTRVVCIREVQNSIKQSVRQLLIDKIKYYRVEHYFDILDAEIRGKNGSLIIFQGMQSYNAANIKSLEGMDVAWIEEAQTLSQKSLDILRPTLRKAGSELWFTWNPVHKTDPVDQFFRCSESAEKISVRVGWQDNPWFKSTPLYQDMLDDYATDEDKAEQVWGGGYSSSQGAILARLVSAAEREKRIHTQVKYDPKGVPVVISCDLGYRDTCAWWYWQPVLGGAHVLNYDADSGLDASDWIARIKENCKSINLGTIWLPHDAKHRTFQSKRTSMQQFQAAFGFSKIKIVPISKKHDQIEAARAFIKRCAFNSIYCEKGLDGLRAWEYEYNEDAGVFSREPIHNWASHPADAFAYGCQVLSEAVKTKRDRNKSLTNEFSLEDIWNSTPQKYKRL